VQADAELLKLVFQTLLLDSAHASQESGTIHVSVAHEGPACAIAVRDAGPGIPPDIRQKIFHPFFATKSRGSGLGLPTARRLVEAHQGTISIDCPPEGGTVVTVRLPVQGSAAEAGGQLV
jgi:signal transduction histidine kinase